MKIKKHLARAENLTYLMDNRFQVMGVKFGLDSILGVVPGAGDMVGLLLSLYLVWIGYTAKLGWSTLAHMIKNVVIDFLVGGIPILGDIADVFYKANTRNLAILKKELA